MHKINSSLAPVILTERDTLDIVSRHNCIYRLLTIFQCLFMFPCFGIRNVYRNQKYGKLAPLIKALKGVFYRFMENPDID